MPDLYFKQALRNIALNLLSLTRFFLVSCSIVLLFYCTFFITVIIITDSGKFKSSKSSNIPCLLLKHDSLKIFNMLCRNMRVSLHN